MTVIDAILDLVVGLWPLWLLLACLAVMVVTLCRAAALGDEQAVRGLSELEARQAVRPWPSSIDVEPVD